MATIDDLANPHFSKISPDERFELIRGLRTARRQTVVKPEKTKLGPREKKPKQKKIQFTGDLAGFSQEQLSQLMELMENASTD
jgi:hypothetical protein